MTRPPARDAIRGFAPSIVVAPDLNDYHPDHRGLSRIVAATCPCDAALFYSGIMLGVGFMPVQVVDITAV